MYPSSGFVDIQSCILRAVSQLENHSSMKQQIISSESQKEAAQYDYDIQLLKNILLGYHSSSTTLISQKLCFINDTHKFILITIHASDSLDENDMQTFLEENGFGDLAVYLQNESTPHLGSLILFISEHSLINVPNFCKQIIQSLIYRCN